MEIECTSKEPVLYIHHELVLGLLNCCPTVELSNSKGKARLPARMNPFGRGKRTLQSLATFFSCYTHHELVLGFQNPISPEILIFYT